MPSLSDAQQRELQTKANARLRRDFNARTFSVQNYRPPTGIGLFDFDYAPAARQINVKVKGYFNFVGPDEDPTYQFWTHTEKNDFKTKAARVIHDAWSNRFQLVCRAPGFSDLSANVDISLVESPRAGAHYIIDSRKVPIQHSSAWAGGCSHGATVWPFTANFSNWGVETRADLLGDRVFNLKEKQLLERIQAYKCELITMAHGTATISPDARDRLSKFTRDAKKILGSDVTGIQCVIYGSSTEKVGSKRANERAAAVAQLVQRELPQFFVVDHSKAAKKKAEEVAQRMGTKLSSHSGVVMYIHVPPLSPRKVDTNYIIITHEFGHMIGCPDEYQGVNCTGIAQLMDLNDLVPSVLRKGPAAANVMPLAPGKHFSTEKPTATAPDNVARLQKQQTAFARQIEGAGVEAPAFFGQQNQLNVDEYAAGADQWTKERARLKEKFGQESEQYKAFAKTNYPVAVTAGASDSIMYAGQKILPAHYLPIWSCLTSLTREHVDPASWAINAK